MMKHILFYLFLITTILTVKGQDTRPNVVIFYVDDLGWQDTNLNNLGEPAPWETPNMDKLALLGAKFSQAYSPMPTCAPSRAAMLSGRNALKTGLTQVSGGEVPGLSKSKLDKKLIGPFTPLRMQEEEYTIAEALSDAGYNTGHVGKWHIAGANGFPEAIHQGFNTQFTDRGVQRGMNDRYTLSEFGVNNSDYALDDDGVPFDSVTDAAEKFLASSVAEGANGDPFFLYMATWLVHTPIQTRDLALLQKISARLVGRGEMSAEDLENGIPTIKTPLTAAGDHNPFYGAMVETVDWSLGKIIDYLEATDDPRNPGKKLFETTYIIFSSDNGASEQNNVDFEDGSGNVSKQEEVVADNFPLDKGKTSSKEGGVRVPLIITGPTVTPNKEYSNVVNGLDFYPTILSATGTTVPNNILNDLDGVDLNPLLSGQTTTVNKTDGSERTDMFFHYANADDEKSKSTIRRGDYKLYKLYIDNSYEAYRLYNGEVPVDLEEQTNVIETMPTAIKESMIAALDAHLSENNAKFPTWNPDEAAGLPNRVFVPSVTSTDYNQNDQVVTANISTEANQVAIASAYLLYVEDGAKEEWHESSSVPTISGNLITANVPETATKVLINMVDENGFLVQTEEITTVPGGVVVTVPGEIAVLDAIGEQTFNVGGTNYAELLGDAAVRGTSPEEYIQTRVVGGGAKFSVKAATGLHSVVCDKVTFGVRSLEGDTVDFDVTIAGQTQSFNYTSTKSTNDVVFDFTGPVTFTSALKEVEIITTAISNSGVDVLPRFRIYDLTFHVSEFVLLENAPTEIVLMNTNDGQLFGAAVDFSELLPNTTVNGSAAYLQNRIVGGGAKYSVKVDEGIESAVCDRIEFRVRSQAGDAVDFDITVGGETQSFDYTSTKTSTNKFVEFDTPITFTNVAQELEIITTALSNASLEPRFRIYDMTFYLSENTTLNIDDNIKSQNIYVTPNPIKNVFSLTKEVNNGVVYNMFGSQVFQFKNQYQNIDISNLNNGLYLLKVTLNDGNIKTFKIFKE